MLEPQRHAATRSSPTARRSRQAREVAQTGVARVPWEVVGATGEEDLAAGGLTVRCLQRSDGSLPESDDDAGALAYVARAY